MSLSKQYSIGRWEAYATPSGKKVSKNSPRKERREGKEMQHCPKSRFRPGIFLPGIFLLSFLIWGQLSAQTEVEPNDEAKQANPLPLNTEIKGFANMDGDEDWYVLTIPAPGLDILVIEVTGISDIDLDLRFSDPAKPNEYLIEMDKNEEGEGEKIVRMKQAPGKFLIRIEAEGTNPNDAYTLRARKPVSPPASQAEVTQALRPLNRGQFTYLPNFFSVFLIPSFPPEP
jgi:hypothetical protein